MEKDPIVIVSIARTPQGKMLGTLKDISATELGGTVIKAVIERAQLSMNTHYEVIMGCVLPAGLGQAPARQAALGAGLSDHTPCTTINKVCGSGMKAVILAHDAILADPESIFITGGMESMTNAPYLLNKARQGYRLGHGQLLDHMMYDGLEDAYDKGSPMGIFAEQCAREYGFTRDIQDNYAISSVERAQKAIRENRFQLEIVPVTIKSKQGTVIIDTDEHPLSVKLEKVPLLPPAFKKDGTITAANSSSIADGAAALILMRQSEALKRGLKPLAKIMGHSGFAKTPSQFTTAPIDAIKKLLEKTHWDINTIDLFEINEAFAAVALAAMRDLEIPRDKLNINGSGIALGHPIGATGARIIVTLVAALHLQQLNRGIAALCIGGGEATAIAIERV